MRRRGDWWDDDVTLRDVHDYTLPKSTAQLCLIMLVWGCVRQTSIRRVFLRDVHIRCAPAFTNSWWSPFYECKNANTFKTNIYCDLINFSETVLVWQTTVTVSTSSTTCKIYTYLFITRTILFYGSTENKKLCTYSIIQIIIIFFFESNKKNQKNYKYI